MVARGLTARPLVAAGLIALLAGVAVVAVVVVERRRSWRRESTGMAALNRWSGGRFPKPSTSFRRNSAGTSDQPDGELLKDLDMYVPGNSYDVVPRRKRAIHMLHRAVQVRAADERTWWWCRSRRSPGGYHWWSRCPSTDRVQPTADLRRARGESLQRRHDSLRGAPVSDTYGVGQEASDAVGKSP